MEIKFQNQKYDLGPHNFVAAGGEGAVYRHNNFAFKILHKGIPSVSVDKIKKLEKVNKPGINVTLGKTAPEGLAYDWVEGKPLAECVTNDFWKAYSYDKAEKVANVLKENIALAHQHDFVLVDLNGNNVLLKDLPVLIDVEAWSLPNFAADYQTAKISPAIRDWQKQAIGKGSDWYALAILLFEFYIGLHPFRAGQIPGYGNKDWQKRMAEGKSAFLAKSLSPNCRPLDGIPKELRAWMEKIFKGERTAPPDIKGLSGLVVQRQVATAHEHFEFILLQEYPEEILEHRFESDKRIVKTKNRVWADQNEIAADDVLIVANEILTVKESGNELVIENICNRIPFEKDCWGIWNGKIYSKVGSNFFWYKIGKLGNGFYAAPETTLTVYPFATKVFNGFCIVDAEGKKLLVTNAIYPVPELDSVKVLSGKRLSEAEILIVGEQQGELREFRITIENGRCEVQKREAESAQIMAALPRKNLLVQIEQSEVRLVSGTQERIFSGTIGASLISHENETLVIVNGKKLYRMRTK